MDKEIEVGLFNLYNFVSQGTEQASDEFAKAAFSVVKRRMEILFPQFFPETTT